MSAMNILADDELPNDIEQLKTLLKQKLMAEENLKIALKALNKKSQQIDVLEEMVRYLKHLKFGRSSEKFNDKQNDLFNEVEELAEQEEQLEEEVTPPPKSKKKKRKPRTLETLPDDIPHHEVFHDLPESEKTCACGCKMVRSGCERSKQLDVVPPQFSVTVNVRHTYACKHCEGQLKTANKSRNIIEKSFVSPSLLAYIIISKYLYALPLHRQEKIYESLKVPLKRNTMANWVIKGEIELHPLLDRFEYYLLRENYLQCDESRLQVLNEPDRRADQLSQMWVRRSAGDIPIILFSYSPSRSGAQACELLKGFSGYLQTDDYGGYNKAVKANQLTQLGCNAHARRKFNDARKSEPPQAVASGSKKLSGADIGLLFYKKLYRIEKEIKDLSLEKRFQIRLEKSVPLMKKFVMWAEKKLQDRPKGSKLGTALKYLVRNQEKLIQYCGHGKLNIDNNLAEGAIRPFVVGRKNWLFSNSAKGAHASAGFYSLIETAKANGLNVFDYLQHLFEVIPQMTATDDLDSLLPWNIKLPD